MSGFSGNLLDRFDSSPWSAGSGRAHREIAPPPRPLYTREQLQRRNASPWTRVQAVLAPLQFLAFLASLVCVIHFLATGRGFAAAAASVVVKTGFLYAIMVTGSFWEKAVFGRYLFAPSFFWEDLIGFVVIALHTASLAALFVATMRPADQMLLALAAYASYVVNAAQFLIKLRLARATSAVPAAS